MSEWYCRLNGQFSGPFSLQELRFLKARGKLDPKAKICSGAEGAWMEVQYVPQLFPSEPGPDQAIGPVVNELIAPESVEGPGEDNAADSTLDKASPPAPPPATARSDSDVRQRVLIGTSIVAGIALLLLLLMFLFRGFILGGGSTLAGNGRGSRAGGTPGELESIDGGSRAAADETPGSEVEEEKIVYEGELVEEHDGPPREGTGGDSAPEDDPPAQAVFRVKRLDAQSPPAAEAPNAGAGAGEFTNRVAREGGQTGEIQITLIWNNVNDLDLHVVCPSGERIWYQSKQSACGGELDVDMNAGGRRSNKPVENVVWPEDGAPKGEFKVAVIHYANHGGRDPTAFEVAIRYGGKSRKFSGKLHRHRRQEVHTFQNR